METYSEREIFLPEDLQYFRQATRVVGHLPDYDRLGRELRCHEVAFVLGHFFDLPVRHGRYELGAQHSWLRLPSHHILDPYCVGRLPPVQLVANVPTMPMRYEVYDYGISMRTDVVEDLERELRRKGIASVRQREA